MELSNGEYLPPGPRRRDPDGGLLELDEMITL